MDEVMLIILRNEKQYQILFEKNGGAKWKNATTKTETGYIPIRVFADTLDEGLQRVIDKLDEWEM